MFCFNKMRMRLTLILIPVFLFVNSYIRDTMAGPTVDFPKAVEDFAVDLYSHVSEEKPNENIILSPLSVQMAVGLALMGARGKTAEEMTVGLKLNDANREVISSGFQSVIEPFANSSMLKIANKIYYKNGYTVNTEFNQIATKAFNSDAAEPLNFAESQNSAKKINNWVEEKTNNKIKDLISPDSLDSDTRMVLVNAIYFKGFWLHQFPKHSTIKAPFYTSETDSIEVDTMHVKNHFRYGEFTDLDAKGIELPYRDSDMSMFILLPNQRTGLAALESKLKTISLTDLTKRLFSIEVSVSLPKFKVEFEISLPDVLKKMGMPTMFSDAADFSGLLEQSEPLKVSEVIHKAYIDVNEEGAEAAAATGMIMMMRMMPQSIQFNADHPFIYMIRSSTTGVNSFFGTYKK